MYFNYLFNSLKNNIQVSNCVTFWKLSSSNEENYSELNYEQQYYYILTGKCYYWIIYNKNWEIHTEYIIQAD